MDSLHAPWRIDYILAPRPPLTDVSLFTRIAQSNDDEANYILARGRTCFALLNTYPYTGGHLMTVPYRQGPHFNGLSPPGKPAFILPPRPLPKPLTGGQKPPGRHNGV